MNFKKIYLFILLVLISVSVVGASEVSDQNMQPDMDNACLNDNQPDDNSQLITDNITKSDELIKNDKNIKMASSKTYDINDYNSLNQALTSDAYDKVTVNINSNIKLSNNTTLNTAIKELNINGNSKTVDGDNSNRFLIINENSSVTIKNLNINNCHYAMSYFGGGAIYNKGSLTITGCSFKNNYAQYGGVIHSYVNNLTVENCEFTDNTAGDDGAVIYSLGSLKITNSTFKNNKAVESGGAIQIERGNITIQKSTFINNTAQFGGAIDSYGNLTIKDTIMNDNHAVGSWSNGGSIFNCNNLTLINTNITNSSAVDNGGAIYNSGGNIIITKSTLSNNTAATGGAIINAAGNITLQDNKLWDNSAFTAGAVYNDHANMTINNTTFYRNMANNTGGALQNFYGSMNINNSALNYNSAKVVGGAVYNLYSNMTIYKSRLNNNSATDNTQKKVDFTTCCGGAIRNYYANLTIKDSNLNYNYAGYDGAAIYNYENASLKIINSTLNSNYAANAGAAIRNCANLTIYNSTLNSNTADFKGAAIYDTGNTIINNTNLNKNYALWEGGALYSLAKCIINNSKLNYNNASMAGAIGNGYNSDIIIENTTLNSNIALGTTGFADGAAIYNRAYINIINSTLNSNYAKNAGGVIRNLAFVNITDCILNFNKADYDGGVIYNTANVSICNSVLNSNYAKNAGGAIRNIGNLSIHNSTLNSNRADFDGGVVYNTENLTIIKSTLNNNSAKYNGGTILNNNNLTVKTSLFKYNTADNGAAIFNVGKYALIESNTFTANKANISGSAIINRSEATISNNINADISKYNATIYTSGKNVIIKKNIFDDEIIYTKITVSTVKGVIGNNLTFKASVTDTNNSKVTNGYVIFKLNGITIKDNSKLTGSTNNLKVYVKNGVATATVNADLNMRNAKILTAVYSGSSTYNASRSNNASAQIALRNASLTVSSNVKTIKQGQYITLTAKIYDITGKSNKLVNYDDEYVYFKVNGITLKNSNGSTLKVKVVNSTATTKYYVPLGLSGVTDGKTFTIKNHTITAGYANKNYYPTAVNTSYFQVERSNITINISNTTINTKTHKLSLKATIKDYLGNIVLGPNKCIIKVNGITLKNSVQPIYYYSNNGILNINNIDIPIYNKYNNIQIVTQDRLAYKSQRNTTTTIKILNN